MKLSVIIPAYNEETRISETLLAVDAYLSRRLEHFNQSTKQPVYQPVMQTEPAVSQLAAQPVIDGLEYLTDYEIIVVVNGSKDRTYDIVKNLETSSVPKAIAINLAQGGKGNAVKRGILDYAAGDIIMFMDADNATPISELEKLMPYFQDGYDIVIGSRYLDPRTVKVAQPLYRIILSRLSNILIQLLAVPGIKDTQLGFKAFTSNSAKDIFRFITINRWGFDMEILTIARERGYRIKEVAVSWTEHGGGHVPLKAYIESFLDLMKIKYKALKGHYRGPADY